MGAAPTSKQLRQRLAYRLGRFWKAAGGDDDHAIMIRGGVRCPASAARAMAASGHLEQAEHLVRATGRQIERPERDQAVLAVAVSLMLAGI